MRLKRISQGLLALSLLSAQGSAWGQDRTAAPEPLQLSLKRCAKLALQYHPGLALGRIAARRARAMYAAEGGRFLPEVRAELGFRRQILGTELEVEDSRGRFTETSPTMMAGVSGQVITGLNYDFVIGSDVLFTSKRRAIISPQFRHRIELDLSHPLLKDFGIEATTAAKETASIGRTVTQRNLDATELDVLASVVVAYWTLYGLSALKAVYQQAVRQVAAHRASFETLSRKMKPDPALATVPEAALATWQVQLSEVESARLEVERELLLLTYGDDQLTPQLLRRGIRPSDRPKVRPIKLSLSALTKTALANRPEIAAVKNEIRAQKIRMALARNRVRPRLDAFMTAGLHSFAGEQTLNKPDYPQVTVPAPKEIRGQYGDAWEQLFEGKLPYFYLGFRFQMPVSTALRKQELALQAAELRRLKVKRGMLNTQITLDVRRAYKLSTNDAMRLRQSQAAYEGIAQRLQQAKTAFSQKVVRPQVVVSVIGFLRDTGTELAKAAAAYMISRARLERTTGGLRKFLEIDPRSADPDAAVDRVLDGPKKGPLQK